MNKGQAMKLFLETFKGDIRVKALRDAETIGVSAACRRYKIGRTRFYAFQKSLPKRLAMWLKESGK